MLCKTPFLPQIAASEISGNKRVDNAPSNVDGKNKSGNAMPFIIPKSAIPLPFAPYEVRQIGTKTFSIMRKSEFIYLPSVIGNAM